MWGSTRRWHKYLDTHSCSSSGTFAGLQKGTVRFVMSVNPRGTTLLILDGFAWSFGSFIKICSENECLIKFRQKCKEFSKFDCIKSNKYSFMCVCWGGLVKSQIDFCRKGRSGEGSVWLQPALIFYPIHYADKENSLSSVYLLPRQYIHINHKVCQQLALMLINDDEFNADKACNWNGTHLLTVLTFLCCAIKHNLSECFHCWHNPVSSRLSWYEMSKW